MPFPGLPECVLCPPFSGLCDAVPPRTGPAGAGQPEAGSRSAGQGIVAILGVTLVPGDDVVPLGYGGMRASTADRERAVDVLKAAFAEGRLDHAEYADRVGRVYSSRTYAELAVLTADLPIGPLGTMVSFPAQPMPVQPYVPAPLPAPAKRKTNGMAVASFFFALGAFVTGGLTAPVAIGLAIVAAVRMRGTGEKGADLAAAAIALSIFELLVFHALWS